MPLSIIYYDWLLHACLWPILRDCTHTLENKLSLPIQTQQTSVSVIVQTQDQSPHVWPAVIWYVFTRIRRLLFTPHKKSLSLDDSIVKSSWVLAVYYFLFYALFKEDSQVCFQSVWGRGGIILIGHFPGVISGVGWLVGFTKTALAVDWCFILRSILYLGAGHVHQIILLVWPWNIVILLICFRCRHSYIKQEPGLTTTSTSIWTKRRQH